MTNMVLAIAQSVEIGYTYLRGGGGERKVLFKDVTFLTGSVELMDHLPRYSFYKSVCSLGTKPIRPMDNVALLTYLSGNQRKGRRRRRRKRRTRRSKRE